MFDAFRRAKAVSVVKTMLHQMLAPLTVLGETIPSTIYEDPYVLGYLTAIAGFGTQRDGETVPCIDGSHR